MKKLVSIIMLVSMMLTSVAYAQQTPKIMTSEDREICLDEPVGMYVDGVFMVPVRRICDIFNASCTWYGDDQSIIINSEDNITRLFLYIGQPEFRIFTFTSLISGEAQDLTLDAPLQIVQDRTMVPFEQICKALKGECVWSEDKSLVTVNVPSAADEIKKAEIYLASDKQDVSAGEEITIRIMAKNLGVADGFGLSGLSAGVIFDKSAFEHVSTDFTDDKGELVEAVKLENKEFTLDSVKTVCFGAAPFSYGDEEVCIGKLVLRAKTDIGGEIRLSNRVYTVGQDTELVYTDSTGESIAKISRGAHLVIHTLPVVFN